MSSRRFIPGFLRSLVGGGSNNNNDNDNAKLPSDDRKLEKKNLKKPLKFPNHFRFGDDNDLMRMIGVKLSVYERFTGGDFWYIYESVVRDDGKKCRFELRSNMPLDKIEPPAVNVHTVALNVYQVNQKNEKELVLSLHADALSRYSFAMEENRAKVAKINSIVGIDKFSFNNRASWDILMNYIGISSYFSYTRIIPGSANAKTFNQTLIADSSSMGGEYPVYNMTFHNSELKGLKAQYSWQHSDISVTSFIQLFEYNGEKLQYSVNLNKEKTTGIITMTFNDGIILKATYPYFQKKEDYRPTYDHFIYVSGMQFDIDERVETHPVYRFVEQIIQLVLQQKKNFNTISELEQEWVAFCESLRFDCLVVLFNFGRYTSQPSLKLKNALTNSSTFSDVLFSFNK